MPPKKKAKRAAGGRWRIQRDRVGDLFADVPDATGEGKVRVSMRRNWYSPPFTEDGEIQYERAADELSRDLTGGTLVVRRILENGDLGMATEIPIGSEEELEQILHAMQTVFVESLQHDNAIRLAGLEACKAAVSRAEQNQLADERRQERERRLLRRRGRQLLGRAWFRKNDRRAKTDRRAGMDRRSEQERVATAHQ